MQTLSSEGLAGCQRCTKVPVEISVLQNSWPDAEEGQRGREFRGTGEVSTDSVPVGSSARLGAGPRHRETCL